MAETGARRADHKTRARGGLSFDVMIDYSYDGTMRAFEQSLHRLALPSVDIALIHDVDVWTHGDAIEDRFKEAMNGAYRALDELRRAGVVKAIGVGVNESAMCARFARAGDIDAVLLAGRYSLLEQPALADFLPLALEKGIGVMLGGVFNSGILATGAVEGAKYNYRPAPAGNPRSRQAHRKGLCVAWRRAYRSPRCNSLSAIRPCPRLSSARSRLPR